jgi:hypothetical protein
VARQARASMVRVGFFSDAEVKAAPSTTNTFLTSCIWQKAFSALRLGSAPMRHVEMFVDRLPWNSHEGRVITQSLRFGFLQDRCRGLIHFGHHLALVFPVLEFDASPIMTGGIFYKAAGVRIGKRSHSNGPAFPLSLVPIERLWHTSIDIMEGSAVTDVLTLAE